MTRFSRTSALLSAASRGKVELIIEHYRAARCCRNQTQHPFTSFKFKKKKKKAEVENPWIPFCSYDSTRLGSGDLGLRGEKRRQRVLLVLALSSHTHFTLAF